MKVKNLQDLAFAFAPNGTIGVVTGWKSIIFRCPSESERLSIYKHAAKLRLSVIADSSGALVVS